MIEPQLTSLHNSLQKLIRSVQKKAVQAVNREMIYLYWHIGYEIETHILHAERAEYGKEVVKNLSNKLSMEFGKGFSKVNLTYFIRFYQTFQDFSIVQTLSEQLSWSHFVLFIALKEDIQRM